ncbi:de28dd51-1f27-477c-b799-b7a3c5281611 [Thermothielavioides terrestris]|uniref:De28dd51-1f27-477c-b799-b7a3c5281611 n=1 Tax=Thermothielavioides terrestris TaxID=2587410 RepID=A0A3S5CXK4_9PEZI|nr:de28dd51-1f27-477c-b799-b7a3c5281611 [Thermothielavioides terrestris]
MTLTRRTSHRNPDEFPTVQLFLLAIVRLAEPIALTSIFPYAWALVKRFEIGSEDDASFYAGLLISAFSLAEALMGMYWGGLSDRVGRKPVLLLGCVGTMFSMVMVGFASNIWVALLGRAIGGLLNGNIGVIQTMVGELVTKPEHEPRAYSIMPFVWSVGTILGPMIGGLFADPHETYPHIFPKGSLFERFPYLLPNLICAGMLLMSILLGYFLLEETHPDMQPRVLLPDDTFQSENTPLIETSDAMKRPAVDLRDENYGTMRSRDRAHAASAAAEAWAANDVEKQPASIFCKRIMAVILSLSIFTYHSMTFDHLLPIFFEDDRAAPNSLSSAAARPGSPFYSPGGLGLSLQAVGMVMAVQGAIALVMQAVVFPLTAERVGVYRLFLLVTVLHPLAYLAVPPLLYVPERWLFPAIYACLVVRNFFSILLYPLLLILIKEATPSSAVLGRVNGLAASAGAACRMVAPPVAGYLYTVGKRMDCTALAWYASALVALVGSVQCFSVKRGREDRGKQVADVEAVEE